MAFYRRFAVVVMPDKGSPVAVELEQGQGEGRVPKKSVHRVEVGVRECSIHSVVVYQDRAEVKRVVPAHLAPGDNQVVVTGLASCINKDSVRSAVNRVSGDCVVSGPQTTIRLTRVWGEVLCNCFYNHAPNSGLCNRIGWGKPVFSPLSGRSQYYVSAANYLPGGSGRS